VTGGQGGLFAERPQFVTVQPDELRSILQMFLQSVTGFAIFACRAGPAFLICFRMKGFTQFPVSLRGSRDAPPPRSPSLAPQSVSLCPISPCADVTVIAVPVVACISVSMPSAAGYPFANTGSWRHQGNTETRDLLRGNSRGDGCRILPAGHPDGKCDVTFSCKKRKMFLQKH
jgi:hypothetical protein